MSIGNYKRFNFTIVLLAVESAADIAGLLMVGKSDKSNFLTHPSDVVGEDFAGDYLSKVAEISE